MNRREFSSLLSGAAALWSQGAYAQQQAAPPSPIRPEWLDRRKEPILEPGLPIIDPHHHLWQRPGWRYLLDDLLTDTGSGHNIVATVYMEASSMYRDRGPEEMRPVGEVEFANGVAAMCGSGVFGKTRVAAGIVGHADKKFREGIGVVGRLGLSYDVSLYHTQIGEVADLAGALPNTRIVLNHVGG